LQSGQEGRGLMSSPEQENGGKQFTETWLVLEYCDKGNLQDAVDRGVFIMPRAGQAGAASNAVDGQCNVGSVRWVKAAQEPLIVYMSASICS